MSNDFYNASGAPASDADLTSAAIRTEFTEVGKGMDKLPALAGNEGRFIIVNSAGTGLEATSSSGASTTEPGLIEIATLTEVNAGTETAMAVTPDTLADSKWTPDAVINITGTTTYEGFGVSGVSVSTGVFTVTFVNSASATDSQMIVALTDYASLSNTAIAASGVKRTAVNQCQVASLGLLTAGPTISQSLEYPVTLIRLLPA